MSNKKIFICIGLLGIIFLGVLLWPNKKTEEKVVIKERKLEEPTAEFIMDSPEIISWKISSDKNYSQTEAYLVDRKSFSDEDKLLIKTTLTGGQLSGKQHYDLDENRDKYEFNQNIESKNEIETGDVGESEVRTSFYELISKLKDVNNNWEVKIENTGYKQFLYPWWVSGTKDDYEAIEVNADYIFKGLPLRTFGDYPIIADYLSSGKLAKIQGQLPFGKISKTINKRLLNLTEIENKRPDSFKIWKVDAGKDYELAEEQPLIKEVDVYDYHLGYIYDFKSGIVWPFYFLEANTQLSTGPAKIVLITSAVKE